MALLKATRGAQNPLVAEFIFNFNDTMKDVNGVEKTFGSVYTDAGTFEVIPLPVGAVITGGEVIVETQGVGPTAYTVTVGDSGDGDIHTNNTTVSLLGSSGTRTALTLIGSLRSQDGKNIRITIGSTVANATAGKFRVRVEYTVDGRQTEAIGA
jgi:hypothetical protein